MTTFRSIADAVRSEVEPLLRDLGFNGEYPHYRRKREGRADLISFQTNNYGGSYIVEIAQAPSEGAMPSGSGDFIPFDQLNVWHLDPHRDKRKRIPAGPFGLPGWTGSGRKSFSRSKRACDSPPGAQCGRFLKWRRNLTSGTEPRTNRAIHSPTPMPSGSQPLQARSNSASSSRKPLLRMGKRHQVLGSRFLSSTWKQGA